MRSTDQRWVGQLVALHCTVGLRSTASPVSLPYMCTAACVSGKLIVLNEFACRQGWEKVGFHHKNIARAVRPVLCARHTHYCLHMMHRHPCCLFILYCTINAAPRPKHCTSCWPNCPGCATPSAQPGLQLHPQSPSAPWHGSAPPWGSHAQAWPCSGSACWQCCHWWRLSSECCSTNWASAGLTGQQQLGLGLGLELVLLPVGRRRQLHWRLWRPQQEQHQHLADGSPTLLPTGCLMWQMLLSPAGTPSWHSCTPPACARAASGGCCRLRPWSRRCCGARCFGLPRRRCGGVGGRSGPGAGRRLAWPEGLPGCMVGLCRPTRKATQ